MICVDCRQAGKWNRTMNKLDAETEREAVNILARQINAAHERCIDRNGANSTWCACHHHIGPALRKEFAALDKLPQRPVE